MLLLENITSVALLSVCWLSGFVVLWCLFRVRMQSLEARIRELSQSIEGLRRGVDARAGGIGADAGSPQVALEVERAVLAVERVRAVGDEVREDVAKLAARIDEFEEKVAGRIMDLGATLAARPGAEPLEQRIHARFAARGYSTLRLIGDVSRVGKESTKIPVEAIKGGVTYKGFVLVEGGHVVDEKLMSAHEIFP